MEIKTSYGKTVFQQTKCNLCDKKPKPELVKGNMIGWAIPERCPVTQSAILCNNETKVFTFTRTTQRMFSLFATTLGAIVRINITHDTGISCFEAEFVVSKIN